MHDAARVRRRQRRGDLPAGARRLVNSHQFTGAGAKEEISYAYYGYDADGASGAIETTAAREDLADPQLASVPLVVNAVGLRRALQRIRDLPELTDPGLVAEVESVTVQTMRLTAPKPRQ